MGQEVTGEISLGKDTSRARGSGAGILLTSNFHVQKYNFNLTETTDSPPGSNSGIGCILALYDKELGEG